MPKKYQFPVEKRLQESFYGKAAQYRLSLQLLYTQLKYNHSTFMVSK